MEGQVAGVDIHLIIAVLVHDAHPTVAEVISQLEEEERSMVFKMIDTFLTKKRFKDFFQKNIAAL